MVRLSLILPTYNEAENIVSVLEELCPYLDLSQDEIIIVDDNSPDGTSEIVRTFASTHDLRDSIKIIQRARKERGLSVAVVEGFLAARGAFLGVMDADKSHDPSIIPQLLAAVEQGHSFAIGSRRVVGGGALHWPLHRRLASNFATTFARRLLSLPIRDPMSGYFIVSKQVFESSYPALYPRGYKILIELFACSPDKDFLEVPYYFRDRHQGYSKISLPVLSAFLRQCLSLRGSHRAPDRSLSIQGSTLSTKKNIIA